MKSKAFLLLCSILSISLTSCNKDDTKQPYSYSYDLISMKNNVSFTNGKGFSPLLVSTDELDHYLNTTLSLIVLVRNENFEKTYEIQTTINTNISNYVGTYSDILYQINQDVIYDAGSWSADDRKYVMQRLKKLGAKALWHQVNCNIDLAKQRTLARSKDAEQLSVGERFFDENLSRYKPIFDSEGLDVVVHND